VFVKICGVTTERAVEAAAEAGADAVGFVFAESVRRVALQRARELCAALPADVLRVAVLRHPTPDEAARVLDEFAPDWIQTDAEDFAALRLPEGCMALPVYRDGQSALADAQGIAARAGRGGSSVNGSTGTARLLFEGRVSGRGERADWPAARRLAAGAQLILAGGLDTSNIAEAIREVRPWGVDVSTGVERAPGVKDADKIKEFVLRAKAAGAEE
jgi:phosphoribosylanthranilate isomerase